ncbi:uncharacterized protein LOC108905848 isoform X2 [Anoplophora glabripennis]|uniref:uncharacterized protein LOC108905848 isoform X2 n=1 Tax=Anoplophora glabripennis TaxID=217634 RepID=UPI000873591A|nr:uncharacterized protein LOC108905848 isoform X2 [Anoplophora glabripennis]
MRGSTAGLPEHFQGYNKSYNRILTVLDSLFSIVVVCPCVVGYWRSIWKLMEIYATPQGSELLSALISTTIGMTGHLAFCFLQKVLEHTFHPYKNRILYYLVSRLYTVCFAFTCVNGWRGPWQLLELHAKYNKFTVLVTTVVSVAALVAIRCLRNVAAPPCLIVKDVVRGYFEVMTMFRLSMGEKTSLYILDCLFSVLIVGTLVVFVWRGGWALLDIFVFPEDDVLSAWASLILGYASVAIAFILQPVMRYLCERFSGTPRLLIADFFILFALFGTINVWRGIWNLLNIYFLPENPELSCWITHWVCLIILILLGCSNSLLVRGVYIDAEEPAGKCVVFPCYYLRIIFQGEKLKQLNLTSLTIQNVKVHVRDSEKAMENNHIVSVSTISTTIKQNHKENC